MRTGKEAENRYEVHEGFMRVITIQAEEVRRNDDGTWSVFMAARPMSSSENETLNRLFPHTREQVEVLLNKEALLGSIVENV